MPHRIRVRGCAELPPAATALATRILTARGAAAARPCQRCCGLHRHLRSGTAAAIAAAAAVAAAAAERVDEPFGRSATGAAGFAGALCHGWHVHAARARPAQPRRRCGGRNGDGSRRRLAESCRQQRRRGLAYCLLPAPLGRVVQGRANAGERDGPQAQGGGEASDCGAASRGHRQLRRVRRRSGLWQLHGERHEVRCVGEWHSSRVTTHRSIGRAHAHALRPPLPSVRPRSAAECAPRVPRPKPSAADGVAAAAKRRW